MKSCITLLVVCYITVSHSALIGTNCEWGPSYWCSSLRNAKQCGAIKHCVATVWKNNKPQPAPNKNMCDYCEEVVGDVKAFIEDKKTEEFIQNYLDQACNIIPDADLAKQCKEDIAQYLPELLDMIAENLDPESICSLLGLCGSFTDFVAHPVPIRVKPKDPATYCADCKKFIGDAQEMVTDKKTEAEVEKFLEDNYCSLFGEAADMCKSVIEDYMPQIFDMLSGLIDPQSICEQIGFCSAKRLELTKTLSAVVNLIQKQTPVKNQDVCEACKLVVAELQNLERNQQTQQIVEDFLKKNVCSRLGSLQDFCEDAIKQYGPLLLELLANELDPNVICPDLHLCSASQVRKTIIKIPELSQKYSNKVGTSILCVECEFVLRELEHILQGNKTEEAIRKALDQICDILPSSVKTECVILVDQYGPLIIQLLVQEVQPQMVCTMIKLCTPSAVKQPKTMPALKLSAPHATASEGCILCELVLREVDSLLEDNATEAEIIKALDDVCNILPSGIKPECLDFVKQYGPAVIKMLVAEVDPAKVCTALGLCKATGLASNKVKVPVASAETCTACKLVMQYLDSLLAENATMEEIKKLLDKICNFLPKPYQQQCDDIVTEYGPSIVQLVMEYADPTQICTDIGLCSSAVKKPLFGSKKCTYGPAYWCVNMKTAEECGAVVHCKNHVWN